MCVNTRLCKFVLIDTVHITLSWLNEWHWVQYTGFYNRKTVDMTTYPPLFIPSPTIYGHQQ